MDWDWDGHVWNRHYMTYRNSLVNALVSTPPGLHVDTDVVSRRRPSQAAGILWLRCETRMMPVRHARAAAMRGNAPEHVAHDSGPRPELRLQLGSDRRVAPWEQVKEHNAGVVKLHRLVQRVSVLDHRSRRANTTRASQRRAHSCSGSRDGRLAQLYADTGGPTLSSRDTHSG